MTSVHRHTNKEYSLNHRQQVEGAQSKRGLSYVEDTRVFATFNHSILNEPAHNMTKHAALTMVGTSAARVSATGSVVVVSLTVGTGSFGHGVASLLEKREKRVWSLDRTIL